MDFGVGMPYTDEQQAFRKEVRTFLDANVPADPKQREAMSIGGGRGGHEFARKLGEKGWVVPTGATERGWDRRGRGRGGGGQHFVFFDNVRVPSENLIGDEGKGWSMANTTLELEHGGSGNVGGNDQRSEFLGKIIGYLKA